MADAEATMNAAADALAAGADGADDRYAAALETWLALGGADLEERSAMTAASLGLGVDLTMPMSALSGGQAARAGLAALLLSRYDVLLLDEPTNDLDVETLGSLENALLDFPGCAVVISHDRWFLDRVATHILAYEGTEEDPSKWYWFEGNFESYEANKIERLGADAARPHRVTYRKLTRD
ncbi:hypothetical protein BJM39_27290 [Salmonella enterica subsp. enterica serovar Javiana]|nr:hypothetical protein BJM39_27290 [Salmonella enterica subsp. enterica serovar Javiana]